MGWGLPGDGTVFLGDRRGGASVRCRDHAGRPSPDRACLRIEGILREDFAGRVLPFDSAVARVYAEFASGRRRGGRPIGEADCQIAAIARSGGMAVATRNVGDFEDIEIMVVDPWLPA